MRVPGGWQRVNRQSFEQVYSWIRQVEISGISKVEFWVALGLCLPGSSKRGWCIVVVYRVHKR